MSQKEQESIGIGKTAIILGAAAVVEGFTFYLAAVPVTMAATYSAGQATLIGYKAGWITYSVAAHAAAITGIKTYDFTTSKAGKKTEEVIEKVGTRLYYVGKPAYDIWSVLSKIVPNFVVNIIWLIYKIIIALWNLVTTNLSIPILDFLNFVFNHFAILLFCGIVFYLLFNQGSPFDLILLIVPGVLMFTIVHLLYKFKNYFYPPIEEE